MGGTLALRGNRQAVPSQLDPPLASSLDAGVASVQSNVVAPAAAMPALTDADVPDARSSAGLTAGASGSSSTRVRRDAGAPRDAGPTTAGHDKQTTGIVKDVPY